MKNGICTMCGSKDVWMTRQTGRDMSYLSLNWMNTVDLEQYCCLGCGFVANYIRQGELGDAAKMQRIREKYTKVPN